MSESLQIPLADLKEWLQRETAPLIKPLKDKGKSLLDEIKGRLDDVREMGDRIFVNSDKEMQKGSPKTYRCAKAANKMSKNISNIISQVVISDDISYENFRLLLVDLKKAFAAIEYERRVWYPRISPYFILDRRKLDITIKRAEDSIRELRSFLFQKYVKAKTAENTLTVIDKLSQQLEEAETIQKRRRQTETSIKLLEKRIQENEHKIGLIQNKAELNELSSLEDKIRDLREKVKYNLRHLQKPFYKMKNLARSSQVALPPDEARKLEQYMNDPFEALISEEEGHPMLKRILQRVDDAIRSGKLKLKAARLRKAREQIDNIFKKDSLNPLQHECKVTISKRKQLLTSQTVATTRRELEQLQALLQNLKREKKSIDSKMRSLGEEYQKMLERIEIQKSKLEKSVFKLTGKRIQVIFPADS
jgi:predicted  nucleic acid-binding Zn-ribbon protein